MYIYIYIYILDVRWGLKPPPRSEHIETLDPRSLFFLSKNKKVCAGATELFDELFLQKWTPHKRSRPNNRGELHRIAARVFLA